MDKHESPNSPQEPVRDYPQNPYEQRQQKRREPKPPREKRNGCLWIAMFMAVFFFGCLTVIAIVVAIAVLGAIGSVKNEIERPFMPNYDRKLVSGNRNSENAILVVGVDGIIHSGDADSPFGQEGATPQKLCPILQSAATDPTVKALIVRINSPGGEVVASDRIYHAIKLFRASGKPAVALMESVAASGGYYVAVGCDKIVAHSMTTTGSIGVIVQTYKYYDLLKKVGLQSEPYTSGPMKDLLSGTRPTSQQEKAIIQQHVNTVYNQFVQICAEGRPQLTVKKIKESNIGDGRIFIGAEAKKLGLVDKLGYFSDAEKLAAELAGVGNDYAVYSVKRKFSLAEILFAKNSAKIPEVKISLPGQSSNYQLKSGHFYFLPPGRE